MFFLYLRYFRLKQGEGKTQSTKTSRLKNLSNFDCCDCPSQGFSHEVDLSGDNLRKIAKNCMKDTKSTFLGKTAGRHGGTSQFFGQWWDPPSPPSHTRENPASGPNYVTCIRQIIHISVMFVQLDETNALNNWGKHMAERKKQQSHLSSIYFFSIYIEVQIHRFVHKVRRA